GHARLVTLTGPGGTGKSRLARETALRLRSAFPDGVWLVELAALESSRHVAAEVARVLGIRQTGPRPIETQIAEAMSGTMLLTLDNGEPHLDECASLAAALLAGSPDLRMLATSRTPLLVRGEEIMPVEPLPSPGRTRDVEELIANPAVAMFVDRV